MRMPVGFRANLRNSACRSGDERDFDARALCHCVLRTGGNSTAVPSHAGVAASWLGGHAGLGPRTPADAFGSSADRPHCSCADIPDDRTPLHIPRSASTTWPPSLALRLSMFATQTTCETSPCGYEIPRTSWPNRPPTRCDAIHGSCGCDRVFFRKPCRKQRITTMFENPAWNAFCVAAQPSVLTVLGRSQDRGRVPPPRSHHRRR